MSIQLILFCFHFATSTGFILGGPQGNAPAVPLLASWTPLGSFTIGTNSNPESIALTPPSPSTSTSSPDSGITTTVSTSFIFGSTNASIFINPFGTTPSKPPSSSSSAESTTQRFVYSLLLTPLVTHISTAPSKLQEVVWLALHQLPPSQLQMKLNPRLSLSLLF
ncbi:uncharacterized protein EV420DRAFT_1651574 [Desarmillaria tabescens]|uniref:REJ domain-containing protein n=1 Tax=Armillaria tabescens TaxID=1929756 RepID=A0AA39JA44_ARMTA|nr:uncharacterized protein EV420DRAFT_1651574 [Desarmillaria tabescens]KAK0438192.1 hypothetical protein EV420DRAFT_1651574 [Desarmillaria tabescens]